jgi:UDP-N-acetylglucosamine 2-epimerase
MALLVAAIIGTRPEAIKMAPVVRALQAEHVLEPVVISTGQHDSLLRDAVEAQELVVDHHLAVMVPGQTLNDVTVRILERLDPLLRQLAPAAVLVQGDTTTVLAASLCAFHLGIPVAHVEAGLRTYDLFNPFPEEANRQLVDRISTWCFAPTPAAAQNLAAEGVADRRIHVTGNTAVDALLWTCERHGITVRDSDSILVTLHRRESFGEPLREILVGLTEFLDEEPTARAIWPQHPNPGVAAAAEEVGAHPRLERVPALGYTAFVQMLADCRLVLTDSGGVQEEAPSFGKPVLVARESTERPEATEGGLNRIVGRDRARVREALRSAWMAAHDRERITPLTNPYGDGRAGRRIASLLNASLGHGGRD